MASATSTGFINRIKAGGRRGFTLIELVLSISIASILLLMVFSFSTLVVNFNRSVNDYGQAQTIAKMYLQMIEDELRFAKYLNIQSSLPDTLSGELRYLYQDGGRIMRQLPGSGAASIISGEGFAEYSFAVGFEPVNEKVVGVSLAVSKEGETLYTINSNIFVNNLISNTITGEQQGVCVSYNLSHVPVSAITVTSPGSTIDTLGQTMQMSALVYPEDADNKGVAWSVDKPECASISQDGVLTPLKNGTVVVTATALDGSGVSGTKQIIIRNQEITITSLKVVGTSEGKYSVKVGQKITIYTSITPDNATNKQLEWSLDNYELASIDSNGVLTAGYVGKTSVIITVRTTDDSGLSDTVEISIKQ